MTDEASDEGVANASHVLPALTSSVAIPQRTPTPGKKTFASGVAAQEQDEHSFPLLQAPSQHEGKPAITISSEEHEKLCAPLRQALVGAFSVSRPSLQTIKEFFSARKFKGQVEIGLLNPRQVLIRPVLQEDYIRLWERRTWTINTSVMRIIKWNPCAHS